jgi:translation elongation factor EF-1beta
MNELPKKRFSSELREMWLSLEREDWTSLAIVPTDPSVSTQAVTEAVAEVSQLGAYKIIEAQRISVADGLKLGARLAQVSGGIRAIVAVDSLMENLGSVSVVNQASRVLVVVRLGVSRFDSLRSTIKLVGRERILGCVLLH